MVGKDYRGRFFGVQVTHLSHSFFYIYRNSLDQNPLRYFLINDILSPRRQGSTVVINCANAERALSASENLQMTH